MNQAEFNDLITQQLETLQKENKALKNKLAAFDNAEETLAKLTISTDAAQSLHNVMMIERKQLAEQSLQSRKEFKEEQEAALARISNAKNSVTSQVKNIYDMNEEVRLMQESIKAGYQDYENMRESLSKRQDSVVSNVDLKITELDRHSGQQRIDELFRTKGQERDAGAISNEIQRQLRLMNPTAFAEPEEQQAEG